VRHVWLGALSLALFDHTHPRTPQRMHTHTHMHTHTCHTRSTIVLQVESKQRRANGIHLSKGRCWGMRAANTCTPTRERLWPSTVHTCRRHRAPLTTTLTTKQWLLTCGALTQGPSAKGWANQRGHVITSRGDKATRFVPTATPALCHAPIVMDVGGADG
jgi:hypothetical protein